MHGTTSVHREDAYSQNDNPINPYSQFSEPGADTVYKARNQDEVDRKKKALTAALDRFEKTPEYISTKQAQNLKAGDGISWSASIIFSNPQ